MCTQSVARQTSTVEASRDQVEVQSRGFGPGTELLVERAGLKTPSWVSSRGARVWTRKHMGGRLFRIWSSASRAEPWKSTGPRKGFNNLRNRISQIVRVVTARPMCGVIEPMRLIWKRESVVGLLWLHQTHGGQKSHSHPHLPHQLLREC